MPPSRSKRLLDKPWHWPGSNTGTTFLMKNLPEILRESLEGKLYRLNWRLGSRIAPLFRDILASRAIRTTVKSLELLYDYANLVQSSNVITDLRPVFDDEADHAIGAIVSFTLRLSYQNGNTTHSLSLAMDAEDVRRLQEQCKRALKKAESAQSRVFSAGWFRETGRDFGEA